MNRTNHHCCGNGNTNAIVSIPMQQPGNIFPAQTAIRNGTLYPELYKPMACAAEPSGCTEPNVHQMIAFSAWEVRLYLNTHPNDMAALQLFQQLCTQTPKPNYACTFVPCSNNRWSWVDDPWPWECEANGRRA